MVMVYNKKMLDEALMVAIKAHGNQDYDGVFPYEKHLKDVIGVMERFELPMKYKIAGALHDTIEDGAVSYNKIKRHFGEEVAEMVYCVTDELGRNRVEKKTKTLPKTASNQDAVIVKLADRIANIEHGGKIDMYAKEFNEFYMHLYTPNQLASPMWEHLKGLLKIEK